MPATDSTVECNSGCLPMQKVKQWLFKAGYMIYSNTRLGGVYWNRDIKRALEVFGDSRHTDIITMEYDALHITPLPVGIDNYCYAIRDTAADTLLIVDPGDCTVVISWLEANGFTDITAILCTHKHWDHCYGVSSLAQRYKCPVYGSKEDSPNATTKFVSDGEELVFEKLSVKCMLTPGHTVGHICFITSYPGVKDMLYSGDHIFMGSIGYNFECPTTTMIDSLDRTMEVLPDDTLLWPGHEYTVQSLLFACSLTPSDATVSDAMQRALQFRIARRPSCPSSIGQEKATNPFIRGHRCDEIKEAVVEFARDNEFAIVVEDRVQMFEMLRSMKGSFLEALKRQQEETGHACHMPTHTCELNNNGDQAGHVD